MATGSWWDYCFSPSLLAGPPALGSVASLISSLLYQVQVLLAQVQNSEQLLQTLQGTVSQAQERAQQQMVRGP